MIETGDRPHFVRVRKKDRGLLTRRWCIGGGRRAQIGAAAFERRRLPRFRLSGSSGAHSSRVAAGGPKPANCCHGVPEVKLGEDVGGGSFYVENRAAAGSNIGTAAAARDAPDGYTLC